MKTTIAVYLAAVTVAFLAGLTAGYWSAVPGMGQEYDKGWWDGRQAAIDQLRLPGGLAAAAHVATSMKAGKAEIPLTKAEMDARLKTLEPAPAAPSNREGQTQAVTPRFRYPVPPEDLAYYKTLLDKGYFPMVILVPKKDVR